MVRGRRDTLLPAGSRLQPDSGAAVSSVGTPEHTNDRGSSQISSQSMQETYASLFTGFAQSGLVEHTSLEIDFTTSDSTTANSSSDIGSRQEEIEAREAREYWREKMNRYIALFKELSDEMPVGTTWIRQSKLEIQSDCDTLAYIRETEPRCW